MNRLIRLLSVGLVTAAPLLASAPVYAASASMSLSPASSSVAKGSTLTINIMENSGSEPVNAAKAVLSYPANLLDFVSIGSSSSFSIVAANSGGGGTVRVDRGALPAVTGSKVIASVRFKAKTNTGTAAINFTGDSSVISANSNTNIAGSKTGGNYTLKAPAAAPPAAPAVSEDKIAPTISDVKVSDVGINSATIAWTTSEPATSQIDYGPDTRYGLTSGDSNFVTDHKIVLNSELLSPGVEYHFVVKSVDPAGNAVSSNDATFKTKGAVLAITVVNQKKKPVSGAKVTLNGTSGVTDKRGQTTLRDLPVSKITGNVTYKGKQTAVSVQVKPIEEGSAPQSITLTINTSSNIFLFIILPLIALLLLAGLLVLRRRHNSWQDLAGHFPKLGTGSSSSTINSSVPNTNNPTTTNVNDDKDSRTEPDLIRPTTNTPNNSK